MSEEPKDVDPELLRESGRASAIQDLADQAKVMGDRAVALEHSTQKALAYEARRWRRTSGLIFIALLLLAGIGLRQMVVSNENKELLVNMEELLQDVDALVAYVEDAEANRGQQSPELQEVFRAIFEIREIICVDPTFQTNEACKRLSEAGN